MPNEKHISCLLARPIDLLCGGCGKKTSTICMGTSSIVPTYMRHPLILAQQALALYDIAPGLLRLEIGPIHRFIMKDTYGLQHRTPMAHLREYVKLLRAALWEGRVEHHGQFYNVVATLPRTSQVPVLVSTLGEKAFQLAGQAPDGALSWGCPVPYLLHTGIPALRTSAVAVGRAAPPLVAFVPVALTEDRGFVLAAGHQILDFYTTIPFYASMLTNAGLPPTTDQQAGCPMNLWSVWSYWEMRQRWQRSSQNFWLQAWMG